jgi:nucleoid DNA-binding protein
MPKQNNPYTEKELKQAYSIVTQDLFNRLVKAKANQTIQIGTLGSFGSLKKTEHQMTSHLEGKSYGNIYAFYKFRFSPSARLKQALNQALEKKYSR